ncbi:MAG: fructose-specific PTS transporter subunit EIIC, partial [Olsenella sp.]
MSSEQKPFILGVTACTAGVAHTYMAAEGLKKAAEEAGVEIKVETQGTTGIENRISDADVARAQAVIFAHDVAIKDSDRFKGLPKVDAPAAAGIKKPAELVEQAMAKGRTVTATDAPAVVEEDDSSEPSFGALVKDSVLTGISYIIPVIIAGGMIAAFCTIITQAFGLQDLAADKTSWLYLFKSLGSGALGTLMVPILSAFMAYSLADKPGLGPGFIGGLAANAIASGFLGGMLSGLIAGFLMRWMKSHISANGPMRTFVTFWVYPVFGSAIVGALMLFVAGPPVAALNNGMVNFLNGLSGTNAAILGAIIGAMTSFDLGGPVNKAAYAFCVGAMANGNLVPYCIFASVKMVSAFSCSAACMLRKDIFTNDEKEIGDQTWLLGLAGITEGAIP